MTKERRKQLESQVVAKRGGRASQPEPLFDPTEDDVTEGSRPKDQHLTVRRDRLLGLVSVNAKPGETPLPFGFHVS